MSTRKRFLLGSLVGYGTALIMCGILTWMAYLAADGKVWLVVPLIPLVAAVAFAGYLGVRKVYDV